MLDRLASVPAVVLVGPRQVGKTTLARKIAAGRPSVYLDLERPADRRRLDDADAYPRSEGVRPSQWR
ncbi:AAA family ATPase [Myxococcota bacterium]|nr:AAA family ATPase [Myxococcota bacterium]